MAKFPKPPAALPSPQIVVSPVTALLWRIYFANGPHPTRWDAFRFFGPTNSRFDHQLPPPGVSAERGILYSASGGLAAQSCLAEVFQTARFIDRSNRHPRLVAFYPTRALRLLDLTGTWPTQAGASMAISSGPRPRAQLWSRAIYQSFKDIDGIQYGSSMNGHAPVQALYERAANAIPRSPVVDRALNDAALTGRIMAAAERLGYGIS